MKHLLLAAIVILIGCNQDTRIKEEKAAAKVEQEVKDASLPYITRDYATIDRYVAMVRDTTLSRETRNDFLDKLKIEYVGYFNWASVEDVNSERFDRSIERTKERIEAKWRAYILQ